MPIALFVGNQDPLATVADADWLQTKLGNVVFRQNIENHDHDFGTSITMDYMKNVINLTQKYNPKPAQL